MASAPFTFPDNPAFTLGRLAPLAARWGIIPMLLRLEFSLVLLIGAVGTLTSLAAVLPL